MQLQINKCFRLFSCSILFCFCILSLQAQKVGINTSAPRQVLHVSSLTDSNLLLLESRVTLDTGTTTSMYFKNGVYYTGAIKTIGQGFNVSRLTFFTFAGADSSVLKERLTILDNGRVGIGKSNPDVLLDVNGRGAFNNVSGTFPALSGGSTVNNRFAPGVAGHGPSVGILGSAYTSIGVGIFGYNNTEGSGPYFIDGAGVGGFSTTGPGVSGTTSKVGAAGILGRSLGNSTIAGLFDANTSNYSGTLALQTIGPLKLTGISEGAGKVLTSDASGNANWQTPQGAGDGFNAYLAADQVVSNTLPGQLTNFTEQFDDGDNFSAGAYTAPATGVYVFTFKPSVDIPANANLTEVRFAVIGTSIGADVSQIVPVVPSTYVFQGMNTRVLKMTVGQQVFFTVTVSRTGAGTHTINGGNSASATWVGGARLY